MAITEAQIQAVLGMKAELLLNEKTLHIGVVVNAPPTETRAKFVVAHREEILPGKVVLRYFNLYPHQVREIVVVGGEEALIEMEGYCGGSSYDPNRLPVIEKILREKDVLTFTPYPS